MNFKPYNILAMNKFMFVILISGLILLPLTSQPVQPEKFREIYFSMDPIGTKTYGIQYKKSLNEHTILRFAFSSFDAGFTATRPAQTFQYPSSTFGIGTHMEAGLEKRVSFTEKVSAFYGIDFVFGVDWMHTRSDDPSIATDSRNTNDVSFSPGIGFKSGILLDLRNGFFAAAEISPLLFYRFASDEQIAGTHTAADIVHDLGFQANADAVKISLAYRW